MPSRKRFDPPAFFSRGRCRDADPMLFFDPDGGEPDALRAARVAAAKAVCEGCPIVDGCLEWALATGERNGIWGGRTEEERAEIRKARRPRPASPHSPEKEPARVA